MLDQPHFRMGFTFRGTYEESVVRPTCEALLSLGFRKQDIFYYRWHQARIAGVGAANTLQRIYHDQCDYVVVLLSPDYAEGNWTGNVEWRAVQDLIHTGGANQICLLSVDGVNVEGVDGLYPTSDIAMSVDGMSPQQIAETIVEWIAYHPRRNK